MTARAATLRRSLRYSLGGRRSRLLAIGACNLVQTLVGLVPVLIIKAFVDDVQRPHPSFARLTALLGVGVGLVLVGGLVGVLQTRLVLGVRTRLVADVRQHVADRLLGQSIGYFTGNRGGELMSRILNDVAVVELMFDSLLAVASGGFMVLGCVIAMFLLAWQLAVVTLLVMPVLVLSLKLAGRPIYRSRMLVQQRLGALTSQLQESVSLSGMMLIKSFGRERLERERLAGLTDDLRRSQVTAGMAASWMGLGLNLLQFAAPAGLLLAGAWLLAHHEITLGTLVAFITVLGLRFAAALASLGNAVVAIVGALPAWARIFEVLDADVQVAERVDATELGDARGRVEFERVTFTYPGRAESALREVSIDVEPGQLVAIVGPSGAGKTTLCGLVPRFHDPQQGAVRIDGHDVRSLTFHSLGATVGLVLQDTYLFHDTLRANLRYAKPDAEEAQLLAACRDAQLLDVIADLPDGLDTIVGERGHRLSGGEKQRVAIARVILKDAPVLILDEATSHLDSLSEHLVQRALARAFRGRTSLVIAHRLSTVVAADLIVVLDGGNVVERGTHAELAAAGGLYQALCELQFRPGPDEAALA